MLIGGSFVGALALAGLLPAMCVKRQVERKSMAENNPPKRPPGEPKPLLEEDITPVLARLDAWYAAHLPPDRYAFNPPATDAELDAFEGLVGLSMPRAYRQLYRWHDGEDDDRWGHIYGLPLLPLHQAGQQWKSWTDVLADLGGNPYEISGGAWPEGAVDPAIGDRGHDLGRRLRRLLRLRADADRADADARGRAWDVPAGGRLGQPDLRDPRP